MRELGEITPPYWRAHWELIKKFSYESCIDLEPPLSHLLPRSTCTMHEVYKPQSLLPLLLWQRREAHKYGCSGNQKNVKSTTYLLVPTHDRYLIYSLYSIMVLVTNSLVGMDR